MSNPAFAALLPPRSCGVWWNRQPSAVMSIPRFPFVLYYGYEPAENLVTIYALMHTSRQPGYWRERLSEP